jgi:predicted RNA-binding Zn ribbon-like protein
MNPTAPTKKFQFIGGELCLDFCNTVGGKRGVTTREYLDSYATLISWAEQAGLLNEPQAGALARKAARRPTDAAALLSRALGLREAIYQICLAIVAGKRAPDADLAQLNSELGRGLGRMRVVSQGTGFAWQWPRDDGALDCPLGPIARSAAELLTCGEAVEHVRQCQGDNCGWLFVDASKNHSRRWCDMRDCGNRAKIRRYRLKQRKV